MFLNSPQRLHQEAPGPFGSGSFSVVKTRARLNIAKLSLWGAPVAPSWRAERCVTDLTIERMRLATVGNNRDPATVYNGPLPCETGRPPYCWWPPTSVEGKKRLKSAFCNEKKFSGHLELDLDQEHRH